MSGDSRRPLASGDTAKADILVGSDGIWSAIRAQMYNEGAVKSVQNGNKNVRQGCPYSGYTVFAGETVLKTNDYYETGYKVYIGPGQYFVITDIGKGNYQWYAFLARPAGYAETIQRPNNSTSLYLQDIFQGWSHEVHDILKVTQEHEIEQRDLYDRPPSVTKPWTNGTVALLGDGIHAMMVCD